MEGTWWASSAECSEAALAVIKYSAFSFSIFHGDLVEFDEDGAVLIVAAIFWVKVAVEELVKSDGDIFFSADVQLEYELLSRFWFDVYWHWNVVLFDEPHDNVLEVRENVLLVDRHFSSSLLMIAIEGEANVWTDEAKLVKIYGNYVKHLSVLQIFESWVCDEWDPIFVAHGVVDDASDGFSVVGFDGICVGGYSSDFFEGVFWGESFCFLIGAYHFAPGFF